MAERRRRRRWTEDTGTAGTEESKEEEEAQNDRQRLYSTQKGNETNPGFMLQDVNPIQRQEDEDFSVLCHLLRRVLIWGLQKKDIIMIHQPEEGHF